MKSWPTFSAGKRRHKGSLSRLVSGDRSGRVCSRSLRQNILSGTSGKSIVRSPGDSRMELYDLLARMIGVFENLHIPYLVTGSIASMAYGEPRLTNDIDMVAGIDETHIPALLAAFPEEEFYLSEDALRDAVVRR